MRVLILLYLSFVLTSFSFAKGGGQGTGIHTLVIDPGHGGQDPGALGHGGHHESNLALATALKFGAMVEKRFPEIKVIYTRKTDKFVSLNDRAEIANKAKADLFICIHLNSNTNKEAFGSSTYVLGLHRTEDNLDIAKRENAVIELEDDKNKNYEFDPNTPEGHIIMSMKQNAFLDQSIKIASKIEDELAFRAKRKSRGVKQAGFYVLYKTSMPSLLAEIGFISNPTEEVFLASEKGQEFVAGAIFKAFWSYKCEIEGTEDNSKEAYADLKEKEETVITKEKEAITIKEEPKSIEAETISYTPQKGVPIVKPDFTPVEKTEKVVEEKQVVKETPKTPAIRKVEIPKPAVKPAEVVKPKEEAPVVSYKPSEPKKELPPVKIAKPIEPSKRKEPVIVEAPNEVTVQKEVIADTKPNLLFRVQLLASMVRPKNVAELEISFGTLKTERLPNGITRYMIGDYSSMAEAKKYIPKAKEMGYLDAFVTAYKNGVRLSGKEIQELK